MSSETEAKLTYMHNDVCSVVTKVSSLLALVHVQELYRFVNLQEL